MDVELREQVPGLKEDQTMYLYLHEVRNAEDSSRTMILAEAPDDIVFNGWRIQRPTGIPPEISGEYPSYGSYIPAPLRGQQLDLEGLPYYNRPCLDRL
jgi:hypothetical protein